MSLIRHAELVVTTSFHTTAFALMFNVNVISVLSILAPARQTSLLKLCGLEERAVSDGETADIDELLSEPNWVSVNAKIREKTTESKAWLNAAIKDCERILQNGLLSSDK